MPWPPEGTEVRRHSSSNWKNHPVIRPSGNGRAMPATRDIRVIKTASVVPNRGYNFWSNKVVQR
jgi:hypothetical protein